MGWVGERRFAEAYPRFASYEGDDLARVWAKRCREADSGWDGVIRLDEK